MMRKMSGEVGLGRKKSAKAHLQPADTEGELQSTRKNSRKGSAQMKGKELQKVARRPSYIEAEIKVVLTCDKITQ